MDATVRRPSSRVHRLIALTVFACISLVIFSRDSHTDMAVTHNRRDIDIRQTHSTPTSLTAEATSSVSPDTTAVSSSTQSKSIQSSSTTLTSTIGSPPTSISPISSNGVVDASSHSSTEPSSRSSTTLSQSPTVLRTSSRASSTTLTNLASYTNGLSSILPAGAPNSQSEPATTLFATLDLLPTSTNAALSDAGSAPSITSMSTPVSAAATSSDFWHKKGTVAATFVIVSLVFLAITAVAVVVFLKRRSKRRQDEIHEDLFERFSENDHRSSSPGPSIYSAPMDAFASREAGFSQSNPFYAETRVVQVSTPVQHPDYYNQNTTPKRYISPSEAQTSRTTEPPSAFRNPIGRANDVRDSHPISIDSFYGAAGQPSAPGYAL